MAKIYTILGMMSGTSLDGLDLAACRLEFYAGSWQYRFLALENLPYERNMKEALHNALGLNGEGLMALHHSYGAWLGQAARKFLDRHGIAPDAIASHGHTVHHRPAAGFTFQLGSGYELAIHSGYPVVCDFRSLDVALGGQGAPLVPIGDRLLFPDFDACLNLGGISNISFERKRDRIAYDIGLANMPLNYLSRKLGKEYDKDGAIARSGKLQEPLLAQLNALEFYSRKIPRSTGVEWFNTAVVPILEASEAPVPDLLHTTTLHVARQLAAALKQHAGTDSWKVLLTGGGARNKFLLDALLAHLPETISIHVPDKQLLDFKEALVFALLGALRLEEKINVLASVTGASRDSCSGQLFNPAL